ncbi:MAG TPA: sialidase family protein [Xanthomonadaceae bacterium]|nr:sialidase family protein [Xanthomonadaceae bacterium]
MRWIVLPLLICAGVAVRAAEVEPWPLPAQGWSAQPNIAAAADGAVHLSWIEKDGQDHVLRHVRHDAGGFGAVHVAARGSDWFVNWADFPSLAVLENGDIVSFVLAKSAEATYAYDVKLVRSRDGGASFSPPQAVHEDGTPTEHGFVSLLPWRDDTVLVAWLDGRNTAGGHGHGGAGGGAMGLRAALVGRDGKQQEWALDDRVCDCCQTAAGRTPGGAVVVFRDRSQGEVRDIAHTRLAGGQWSAPAPVHADGWTMPACPVNGPALDARGEQVHVAWYTAADDAPAVRLARSDDGGAAFAPPLELARGAHVQGRVDVERLGDRVLVSWIGEDEQGQTLWLSRVDAAASKELERVEVARLPRGHGTGFPRMAVVGETVHLVYTDIVDRQPQVRGARVRF